MFALYKTIVLLSDRIILPFWFFKFFNCETEYIPVIINEIIKTTAKQQQSKECTDHPSKAQRTEYMAMARPPTSDGELIEEPRNGCRKSSGIDPVCTMLIR